jgi:hypothetical protein
LHQLRFSRFQAFLIAFMISLSLLITRKPVPFRLTRPPQNEKGVTCRRSIQLVLRKIHADAKVRCSVRRSPSQASRNAAERPVVDHGRRSYPGYDSPLKNLILLNLLDCYSGPDVGVRVVAHCVADEFVQESYSDDSINVTGASRCPATRTSTAHSTEFVVEYDVEWAYESELYASRVRAYSRGFPTWVGLGSRAAAVARSCPATRRYSRRYLHRHYYGRRVSVGKTARASRCTTGRLIAPAASSSRANRRRPSFEARRTL